MKYNLKPNISRPLSEVIVGCADDARWRHVDNSDDRIDSVIRHERRYKFQCDQAHRKSVERRHAMRRKNEELHP